MLIRLYGEGNTDVTTTPMGHQGALRILLRRLLRERVPERSNIDIVGMRLPRLTKGSGYQRKVRLAIAQSSIDGADGIAIVVDRDGPANAKRLALLKEGRTSAEQDGRPLAWKTAVGVAVEMLEAWLIADTGALARITEIKGAFPDPQSIPNPKTKLDAILKAAQLDAAEGYDQIADEANIEQIKGRCPAFAAFADDVSERLAPKER